MNKKITIIIPCFNEEKYIAACLDSVLNFDYNQKNMEIFVVDGMSNDNTREIVKEYEKKCNIIKLIDNIKRTVPIAMNIGIKMSSGDYICRLDAHAIYPKDYLLKLLKWSQKLDADNVGAVWLTDVKNKTKKSNAIKKVLSHKLGVGNSNFRIGSNDIKEVDTVPFGFFKREVFDKYGFYDERLTRNQDIELNKRIKKGGGKIYLIPFVKCTYFAREDFYSLAKNNFANGKWNILTAYYTKKLNSLSLRHFIPLIFVFSIIFPIILSLFDGRFIYISISILLVYFMVIFLVSYKLKDENTDFLNIVKSFLTLHVSYGIGSLMGIIESFKRLLNDKI